jgi:hypothetical protein
MSHLRRVGIPHHCGRCQGWIVPTLLALLPCVARAHLDPETKKPYQIQVVLHIAENRFLTPLFHDQVERDIQAELQLTFGPLANVEVVRQHLLLRDVLSKGLQQALDGWGALSDRTTCFVLIDYASGEYRVQSRLHDGMSGLASPGVRQAQTSDRRHVAEHASRLIGRDFGLSGTVTDVGKEVEVTFRGGGLGVPLERWLKPGEVLAVARVTKEGGKLRAARIPWAVLQVITEPREGKCRCRLLNRFTEDRLTGEAGYRCVRLPTVTGALRLRLIDAATFEPLDGLQVHVRAADGDQAREYTTNREGLVTSSVPFAHVAQVEVLQGTTRLARFPVELVDDRPVTCRLKISALAEAQAPLEYRRDQWVRRLYDNLRVASSRVNALNHLLVPRSLEKARQMARHGLKSMEDEIRSLEVERSELIGLAVQNKLSPDRFLREGDQRLDELRKRKQDLAELSARLDHKIGSEKMQALFVRAQLFENEADIEEALRLYDEAIALAKPLPLEKEDADKLSKTEAHVAELRQAWTTRGPEHDQARAFVYQVWPVVEPAKLSANLAKAKQALEVCRKAGDRLTLRKLALGNAVHADNLKKRLEVLKAKETADNRTEAALVGQVALQLYQLHEEVMVIVRPEKK